MKMIWVRHRNCLVIEYILAHMDAQITTKMLATRFGLVSLYLSRLFKAYKGRLRHGISRIYD